ncbi:MAG: hypothetical protein Q8907_14160 [Bacteroidota bacterium]|nr:hypothetical protein [Bacteroidota bacterium]MDP4226224.1 hypothetical protein [Bacteroidota bacterium]MDP4275415.1 hypothetical protein [Bacteroidota bacterium]
MKQIIIYVLICTLVPAILQAQETKEENKADSSKTIVNKWDINKKEIHYPRLHWGFSGEGGTFNLMLKGDNLSVKNDPSYGGNLFFELKFAKWIGLETGGSYIELSGKVKVVSYSKTYTNLKDNQGDNIDLTVEAKGLEESLTTSVIEIPLSLRLEWNPGKWTLYLKPGVAYTIAQTSNYKQRGTYTRTGYYPDFGITFTNLSEHGFYTEVPHKQEDNKLELNSGINPFIGAGVIFPGIQGHFYIEGKYYPGSFDFKKSENGTRPFEGPGYVYLPSNYAFSSATALSEKVGLGGFMVTIGFRFR